MIPLYLAAAGVSWALTGDFGARNVFERLAGLADGGYMDKPLRPVLRRGPGSAGGRAPAGGVLRRGACSGGGPCSGGGRGDRRRQQGQRGLVKVWG